MPFSKTVRSTSLPNEYTFYESDDDQELLLQDNDFFNLYSYNETDIDAGDTDYVTIYNNESMPRITDPNKKADSETSKHSPPNDTKVKEVTFSSGTDRNENRSRQSNIQSSVSNPKRILKRFSGCAEELVRNINKKGRKNRDALNTFSNEITKKSENISYICDSEIDLTFDNICSTSNEASSKASWLTQKSTNRLMTRDRYPRTLLHPIGKQVKRVNGNISCGFFELHHAFEKMTLDKTPGVSLQNKEEMKHDELYTRRFSMPEPIEESAKTPSKLKERPGKIKCEHKSLLPDWYSQARRHAQSKINFGRRSRKNTIESTASNALPLLKGTNNVDNC